MSKSKLELAQEEVKRAINKTNEKIEELGDKAGIMYDNLVKIQSRFNCIRNVPNDKKLEYEKLKKIRLNWKHQVEKIEKDYEKAVVKNAGTGAVGAGVGVAVATMGPTVAMGIATTFGVASTGTAIATLSGAAATNAALAWLGGGALAAGGGGMLAGEALLALAGPVGWTIAGCALLASGLLLWRSKQAQKRIESVFVSILHREVCSYNLAFVELNERIDRIINESFQLENALGEIMTFGQDYNRMSEQQQYQLGAYVNLMSSSTQLLVNPIKGLQPNYTYEALERFVELHKEKEIAKICDKYKDQIISLVNLLYDIKLDNEDRKLLRKTIRQDKMWLESLGVSEKVFDMSIINAVYAVLDYKISKDFEALFASEAKFLEMICSNLVPMEK